MWKFKFLIPLILKVNEWEENSQEKLHYDHFRVQETLTNIISGLLGEKNKLQQKQNMVHLNNFEAFEACASLMDSEGI